MQCLALSLLAAAAFLSVGCDREFGGNPTAPASTVIALSTADGRTTLQADGLDSLEIRAAIGREAVKAGRVIVFTSTGGTLEGASGDGLAVDVTPSAGGVATVRLKSSRTPGPVTVSAQIKDGEAPLSGRESLQLTFVEPDQSEVLRFVEAPTSAPADGATASTIAVRVSDRLPGDGRTVAFKTTAGTFEQGGTVMTTDGEAGTDLVATVLLYSPGEPGPALVTATLDGFVAETRVEFLPAAAEEIRVELDQFTLARDGQLGVTATLLRRVGTPSAKTIVRFRAVDSGGTTFGTFRNVQRSQASGEATATFFPDGGGTLGRAVIEVTADGSSAVGRAEFVLVVLPPSS